MKTRSVKKEKLNLSVREEFKRLAERLAKERRRTVSALFEDLLEQAQRQDDDATRQRMREDAELGKLKTG